MTDAAPLAAMPARPRAVVTVAGIACAFVPEIVPRPVFVAEQPGPCSDARATPHTGLGTVIAWLDPVEGGERLAWVKRGDGRLVPVRLGALRPADNVVARRILPRADQAERRHA